VIVDTLTEALPSIEDVEAEIAAFNCSEVAAAEAEARRRRNRWRGRRR
jgi:hypothetical protein